MRIDIKKHIDKIFRNISFSALSTQTDKVMLERYKEYARNIDDIIQNNKGSWQIDYMGNIEGSYDENYRLHSYNDLPAVITIFGKTLHGLAWYKHGELHRENGEPAYVSYNPYVAPGQVEAFSYCENGTTLRQVVYDDEGNVEQKILYYEEGKTTITKTSIERNEFGKITKLA